MPCSNVKKLTLSKILSFQRPSNNIDFIFFLGDSKVNPIINHVTKSRKFLATNVEEKNLGAWYILGPIELVSFVASYDKNIFFIYDHNFSFTDLAIKHFKASPLHSLKVIKSMLVQLGKVEKFLLEACPFLLLIKHDF